MSDEPVFAAFNQGVAPTIACFNQAKTPLGVGWDELIAALQAYVTAYLHTPWNFSATLVKTKGFLPGAWAMVFVDDADVAGALAYHDLTPDGMPFAKVFVRTTIENGDLVSVSASHELAEMAADAAINLMVTGADGSTMYALENADPVEALSFSVNGIPMSNFVHPSYFEAFRKPGSVQFDHMRKVTRPFQILKGGYQIVFSNGQWSQIFGSEEKRLAFEKEDRRGHRSETRKKKHKAHTLPQAVDHVGTALEKIAIALKPAQGGLSAKDAKEVFSGLSAHVDKLSGVGLMNGQAFVERSNKFMAANDLQDFKDLLAAADTETNRIAQRIADLMAGIVPGMTQADVDTVKAGLSAEVDKLKGVGVVPTP
jgi:hypothetical protein